MSIIFRIAKAELRNLFYSPVAWVIIVAFFMVCGLQFGDSLVAFAAQQQFKLENTKGFKGFNLSLTMVLFEGPYKWLTGNLFLFIPLLTMGIINREVHAGTIKLLNSSPVHTRDIVLGKFFGMSIFNFILMLPVSILMCAASFSIVAPDYLVFFSALIGIYLLTCTYTAIGMFISALTNYQLVAALCTFLVLIVMNNISMFWQEYDFFRDLTWFLNMAGRIENFLVGLITTSDLFYFLLIIFLFIGFTVIKLNNLQESGKWYKFFLRYFTFIILVLMMGYFSSRPAYIGYLDMSRDKINTIHPVVQEVIAELHDEPLEVTLYTNLMDPSIGFGMPSARNKYVWGFWGGYQRFHPQIRFHYVYYYDLIDGDSSFYKTYPGKSLEEVARKTMRLYGLPSGIFKKPEEIRSVIDLSGIGKRMVMQLQYKGRKTFLRTYDDVIFWPNQQHVAAAISRLTRDTTPKVLFSTAHYERSPYKLGEREYAHHSTNYRSRQALLNLGVDADTINLETEDIPSSTSMLVIADPKAAFSENAKQKVAHWVNKGGDAIFYGEPGKQEILNPLLQPLGLQLESGLLVRKAVRGLPGQQEVMYTDTALYMAEEPALVQARGLSDTTGFVVNGTASISYEERNGFRIEPIFLIPGAPHIWKENGKYLADSAAPVFSGAEGDLQEKQYVTGVKLARQVDGREQRIAVFADADFMSALNASGGLFGNAAYSWTMDNLYPFYINYPAPQDKLLTINRRSAKTMRIMFVYLLPLLVLSAGLILLIRRKRK